MTIAFSDFALGAKPEGAFEVLALAKRLGAQGKHVYELEIGDSPFPTPAMVAEAGIEAIRNDQCHYGPAVGLDTFRQAASDYVNREFGLTTTAANVVAGPGAKTFQLLFCETFLNPGDGVLVFSPYFPTYAPNIERRNARLVLAPLSQDNAFRPDVDAIDKFIAQDPSPKAIFLNSPHNPTGGVATEDDLRAIAALVRGTDIAVFSDEPYDQMVWDGRHHSILAEPDMLDQCVAAYTFSKSFSMSGWRLGFAVTNERTVGMFDTLTNTVISCVPPFTQIAGTAALTSALAERDQMMDDFRQKLTHMVDRLNRIDGVECLAPAGSFYVFPSVAAICHQNQITSHGLAMYLLEAADDKVGVACLGGECFGEAGGGFIRLSSSEPQARLLDAIDFMAGAFQNGPAIADYMARKPEYQLRSPYLA